MTFLSLVPPVVRRAIWIAVTSGLLAGVVSLLLPKSYRAEVLLLPTVPGSTRSSITDLVAGANLSGLVGGALGSLDNPVFTYPEILSSRDLRERVLSAKYPPNSSQTVSDALGIQRATPRERLFAGLKAIDDAVEIRSNPRSGIVAVAVVTHDSLLSKYVAEQLLEGLNTFNFLTRRSQGRATREFLANRVEEAKHELEESEDALARFRNANLRIGNSPSLTLQAERLERAVASKVDLHRLLSREYELARIEEQRDMPSFTLIQGPTVPLRKHRPLTTLNVLIAMGFSLSIYLGFHALKGQRLFALRIRGGEDRSTQGER